MEVPVTLATCGIDEVAMIAKECLKHVMYMHGQIPSPFDEFRSRILDLCFQTSTCEQEEEKESAKTRRMRRSQRRGLQKIQCFTDDFSCLIDSLQPALRVLKLVRSVTIILGNTPTRPKELYQLELLFCDAHLSSQIPLQGVTHACPRSPFAGDTGSAAVRKVIRALITCGLPYKERGPLKLFILLSALASSEKVPNFLPKREFSVRQGKAHPVTIRLQCGCNLDDQQIQEPTSPSGNQDYIWYLCQLGVKGLRTKQAKDE